MAMFPKVQSPCPYAGNLSAILDGDMCRLCKREVFDLTGMTDEERVGFMTACRTNEVCVTYRLPVRAAFAAAVMAAALATPLAAAAQDAGSTAVSATSAPSSDAVDVEVDVVVAISGGITDPQNAEWADEAELVAAPPLPVIFEDSAPAAPSTDAS